MDKKTAAAYWNVKCIHCGLEKVSRSDALKNHPKCKCQQNLEIIGQTFGDFEVLQKTPLRALDKAIIYQCRCIHCGHIENVAGNVLRQLRKNCSKCHDRKSTLIDMTNERYGYLEVLSRDTSQEHLGHERDAYWICKCLNCGTIKSIRGISLRNGTTRSCGCIKSHGEEKIATLLNENGIAFEREYSFDDLRYENKLRFDFAIFNEVGELSHLVEYDGSQHFIAKNSGWNTEENLAKTQLRDKIKDEYCKDKGIPLVRIAYNEEITLDKILFKHGKD